MKFKAFLIAIFVTATAASSNAQTAGQVLSDLWNRHNGKSGSGQGSQGGRGFSNTDAIAALREALNIGAQNAGNRLHTLNGYFGNAVIKILMPAEAQKVETTLRNLGMGKVVDKAIESMNRAAEDAAVKAAPIFIDAIRTMSIQDGLAIVRNGKGAATNYLRQKTTVALTSAFRPVIEQSLSKVNATALWGDVFRLYNQLPTTFNKINPDLPSYVTERALNGLFITISEEENKIRTDPASRVTDLLRKVFG